MEKNIRAFKAILAGVTGKSYNELMALSKIEKYATCIPLEQVASVGAAMMALATTRRYVWDLEDQYETITHYIDLDKIRDLRKLERRTKKAICHGKGIMYAAEWYDDGVWTGWDTLDLIDEGIVVGIPANKVVL